MQGGREALILTSSRYEYRRKLGTSGFFGCFSLAVINKKSNRKLGVLSVTVRTGYSNMPLRLKRREKEKTTYYPEVGVLCAHVPAQIFMQTCTER